MVLSMTWFPYTACLFAFVLNFCFTLANEQLQRFTNEESSLVKRAEGKTFEIPFDVVVSTSSLLRELVAEWI